MVTSCLTTLRTHLRAILHFDFSNIEVLNLAKMQFTRVHSNISGADIRQQSVALLIFGDGSLDQSIAV